MRRREPPLTRRYKLRKEFRRHENGWCSFHRKINVRIRRTIKLERLTIPATRFLRGIAPGSYTAFAWESIPDTAWLNKEFLSKYQDLGVPVTLLPGAQIKLQLKSIPFDAEQR